MGLSPPWFLCPSFDLTPDSIVLGQIIADPSDPTTALNSDYIVPLPKAKSTVQEHYTTTARELRNSSGGVLGKFLSLGGMGRNSSTKNWTNDAEEFEAEEIVTESFPAESEYLHESINSRGVERFLEASRFRKPIYMVTGLKRARGARLLRRKVKRMEAAMGIFEEDDEMGLDEDSSWPNESSRSNDLYFQLPSDFVFAYQLRKISVRSPSGKSMWGGGVGVVGAPVAAGGLENSVGSEASIKRGTWELSVTEDEPAYGDEGIKDVVAETITDFEDRDSNPVVIYSAEQYDKPYTKGALLF